MDSSQTFFVKKQAKFSGFNTKITDRDVRLLSLGNKTHVDGFDHYHMSAWSSFSQYHREKIIPKRMKKTKPMKKKTRNIVSVDKQLSQDDVLLFLECCKSVVNNLPPEVQHSSFVIRNVKNHIFCGMMSCKHCSRTALPPHESCGSESSTELSSTSVEVIQPLPPHEACGSEDFSSDEDEQMFERLNVLKSTSISSSISSLTDEEIQDFVSRPNDPEEVDFDVDLLMLCGDVESNPGPDFAVGCTHQEKTWQFIGCCEIRGFMPLEYHYIYCFDIIEQSGVKTITFEPRGSMHCVFCKERHFHILVRYDPNVLLRKDVSLSLEMCIDHYAGFPSLCIPVWNTFLEEEVFAEDSYVRDLTTEGIEPNPGPFDLNGDTHRVSKTYRKEISELDRLKRLENRKDSIGETAKRLHAQKVKQNRQKAAKKCDKRQIDKLISQLAEKESLFSIEHRVSFTFMQELNEMIQSLPDEFKQFVRWTDVIASIHVLISEVTWSAKYCAIRVLYREFNVSGVSPEHLLMMCVGALSAYFVKTEDVPLKQSQFTESADFEPISAIITVVLTFLFGKKPGASRVNHLIGQLGELPRRLSGLDSLLKLCKKLLSILKGSVQPEQMLEVKIKEISSRVMWLITREGDEYMMSNPLGFEEVTRLVTEACEIEKVLPKSSLLSVSFAPILYQLRCLHRRVLAAPVSGHSYRKEPVVLHIWGKPGMGKTAVIHPIAADALKHLFDLDGMPENKQREELSDFHKFVYWRPIGHKYETNYNSAFSRIYVVDDANQIDVEYLNDDLPFGARLIHFANSGDLLLPVAEIENKRTAKFKSDLIIATDNEQTPALYYLQSADAYKRRITIQAEVTVKEEFTHTVNGIRVVDPSKVDTTRIDTSIYNFKVKGQTLSYDQLLERVRSALTEKHTHFNRNHSHLKNYALRNFQQPIVDPPVMENVPLMERIPQKEGNFTESMSTMRDEFKIGCFSFLSFWKFLFLGHFSWREKFHLILAASFLKVNAIWSTWWKKDEVHFRKRTMCIIATALTIISGVCIYRRFRKNPQTENYQVGQVSRTVKKPRNKPRGKVIAQRQGNEIDIQTESANEFANGISSSLDGGADNVCRLLTESMYNISVTVEGRKNELLGFFVRGRIFVCNAHLLDVCDEDVPGRSVNDCVFSLVGLRNTYLNIPSGDVSIYKFSHGEDNQFPYDILAIEFGRSVKDHKNLYPHIMSKDDFKSLKGNKMILFSIYRHQEQWMAMKQHTSVLDVNDDWFMSQSDGNCTYNFGSITYHAQTSVGFCGSVCVVNNTRYKSKICGIHMASFTKTDTAFGALLFSELLEDLMSQITIQSRYSLDTSSMKQRMDERHSVVDDSFEHITVIPHTIQSQSKTKIRKSVIHGLISEPTKAPARLGYHDFDGVRDHVVNRALQKYLGPSLVIDANVCSIFSGFLNRNFSKTRSVKEFDIQTSIRGIEGDEFINAINRSSSPGYPFVKYRDHGMVGKTTFLGQDDDFIYDHPLLLEQIKTYCDSVAVGERPLCFFTATVKDELRSLDRVAAGKTRSFAAAPLHYVVLFRQKFLDLFANIMENRISNTSLVGINPYSDEWDYCVSQLCKIADPTSHQFLAGDFKNFDGDLNQSLLWTIFDFIEQQYGREDDALTFALWTDITNSLQIFGNSVIEVSRGQPSGNPGTTIINSLYNSSLIYTVVYLILIDINSEQALMIKDNLLEHLRVLVYGDDNIMSFSKELSMILDPSLISEKMKMFGHTYTSDDKTSNKLFYRTLFEISILKRKFSFDKSLKVWLAPLELPSILEPLNWDKVEEGQDMLKTNQMSVNVCTAIRELSLHSEALFLSLVKRIREICKEYNIVLEHECFFTQQQLRKLLKQNSVFNCGKSFYSERPTEQPSVIDSSQRPKSDSPLVRN